MRFLLYIRFKRGIVFHELAKRIYELVPDTVFAAHNIYFDYNRKLLEEQNDIKYEKIYDTDEIFERYENDPLDQDYIQYFEKEYGDPNAWIHFYTDRDILPFTHHRPGYQRYTHEEIQRWFQAIARHIEQIFDDFKPDVYLDFAQPSAIRSIVRAICTKRGILNIIPIHCRYKNYYFNSVDGSETWPGFADLYNKRKHDPDFEPEVGYKLVEEFREQNVKPPWAGAIDPKSRKMQSGYTLPNWLRFNTLRYLWREFRRKIDYKDVNYRKHNNSRYSHLKNVWFHDKMKYEVDKGGFFEENPDLTVDYAFFPLHLNPESSVCVLAPYYLNDFIAIESFAKSIPLHYKLYVKEHIPMLYARPAWFYEKLKEIPNVVLLHPYLDSKTVISNSKAVTVITGTAAFEASILGIPAILLGNSWFRELDLMKQETDITKLPEFFRNLDKNVPDKRDAAIMMQNLVELGFQLEKDVMWSPELRDSSPDIFYQQIDIMSKNILNSYKEWATKSPEVPIEN